MVAQCDVGIEEGPTFALLQMRTEALDDVDAALARLDAGRTQPVVIGEPRTWRPRVRSLHLSSSGAHVTLHRWLQRVQL